VTPAASGPGRIAAFLGMIRFSHTVFALPFALAGMLLPRRALPEPAAILGILAAMVGARTAAMTFNRLADHRLDAANPRTAGRALPAGTLSRPFAAAALLASVALFVAAAASLNRLCLLLAGPTLVVLLGYSLTKRWTPLCHLALGAALGISPLGAYLGVSGAFDGGFPAALLLGLAVTTWVAGFDVVYACQDVDADRALGLHSVPARWGIGPALRVARVLHGVTAALLVAYGREAGLGPIWWGTLVPVGVLLVLEHRIVREGDLARMDLAFFRINAAVSILVLAGTAGAILL
jgi:4-hydroxybenzoate polyprenyltransferase